MLFSIFIDCVRVLGVEWGVCMSWVVFVRVWASFEAMGNRE